MAELIHSSPIQLMDPDKAGRQAAQPIAVVDSDRGFNTSAEIALGANVHHETPSRWLWFLTTIAAIVSFSASR